MVIDTSAVLAILFAEPEAQEFIAAIEIDPVHLMSAPNVLEAMMVIEVRKGAPGVRELELMLHKANIDVVPFTKEHAVIAHQAWRKYGKSNHAAGLNLGDCFSYALAKSSGEPLLFKGNDFSQTDIQVAIKNN